MILNKEQREARERNLEILHGQTEILYETLDRVGDILGRDRSNLLKEAIDGLLRRSYIFGQDVIFDGIEEASSSGKPLMDCLADNDVQVFPLLR